MKLGVLLAESDPEAAQLAAELATLARGSPIGESLAQLAESVESYDFETALDMLERLPREAA